MPYTITRTNGTFLVTVNDLVTDKTATSLALPAKGVATYGLDVAENFVTLLENFANLTPPPRSLTGQVWFDTNVNLLRYNLNGTWAIVGADAFGTTTDTPPGSTLAGNTSSAVRIAGTTGVPLAFGGSVTTVSVQFAEGNVIAVTSPEPIPFASLPTTIVVEGISFTFKSRFPNGLVAGVTLATDTNNTYSYAGSNQFASMLQAVPYLLSGDDTGAVNTIVAIIPSTVPNYAKYLGVEIKVLNTNTSGTVTININGIGAVPVLRRGGIALQPGDLQAGYFYRFLYDGVHFRVTDASANGYVGPTGPAGAIGPTGPASTVPGPVGPAGAPGSIASTPATTNTLGGVIVGSGLTVTSNGTLSIAGANGTVSDGTVVAGSGAPNNNIGQSGDYYIDVLDLTFYGPKTNVWASSSSPFAAIRTSNDDFQVSVGTRQGCQVNVQTIANFVGPSPAWATLSNGRVTVNANGVYAISTMGYMTIINPTVENAEFRWSIFINGYAKIGNIGWIGSPYGVTTILSTAITLYLQVGDIIDVRALLFAQNYDDSADYIETTSILHINKLG